MIMVKQIGMGKDYKNIPCGVSVTARSNKDSVFRHFTIGELTKSETAERFGIDKLYDALSKYFLTCVDDDKNNKTKGDKDDK